MRIQLEQGPIETVETEALAAVGFDKDDERPETLRVLDQATQGAVEDLYRTGEFSGKPCEILVLHRPAGLNARRLVLVGAGKRAQYTTADTRKSAGAALRTLKGRSIRDITMALDASFSVPPHIRAAVEGAVLGDFEPDHYKSDKKDQKAVDTFRVIARGQEAGAGDFEAALRGGQVVAESQNLARALVNEPANRLSPSMLAERAREMAAEAGLEFEMLDRDRMQQLGMGALLGVASGSAQPPALIVLRYRPAEMRQGMDHLGLVGKGVTFDSGGLSIKPADGMEKMKYDMAGGAAVIGAMRALAHLKPPIAVTAFIPAVENMTGSRAQRPGDIVTSLSGKTIEVLNTDAEGRLILADALAYARRLGCTHMVDAATLTGAIVVALGHVNIGAFSTDEVLLQKVLSAGKAEGEKMWPMPLDEEYKDQLKSAFADLPNIGSRWGGAITAAMFLREFVEETPWVHLDIAGTAWLDDGKPFLAKGPSGVAVRSFVHLAMNWG